MKETKKKEEKKEPIRKLSQFTRKPYLEPYFSSVIASPVVKVEGVSTEKGKEHINIDSNLVHYKNIKILGTTGTTVQNYHRTLELLVSKKIDISQLITARFQLEKYRQAFELAKSPGSLKVLFDI